MDRITKTFLESFSKSHDLMSEDVSTQFENFANYSIIDPYIETHYSVKDVNIGANSTVGIDGFALILNGHLICEIDELNDFLRDNKKAKADVYFVQAKTSTSFDAKEISSFAYSVADFVSETPKQAWSENALEKIQLFNALIKRVADLKNTPECHLYYVCLGKTDLPLFLGPSIT